VRVHAVGEHRADHRVEERTLPADRQFGNLVAAFAATVLGGGDLVEPGEDILRQAALVDAVREQARRC
jgi:NDP-hexose-3-ketoreductase